MCLIAFAFGLADRGGPVLRLASNRDEFYSRPTEPAHWWADAPEMLAGRDLQAGGTWLAASRRGRVAAITNHRNGLPAKAPRSRGTLVADFVRGDEPVATYARRIAQDASSYGGFNLLLFELAPVPLVWYVTDLGRARQLVPGLYGISNARLDSPWPKVERLKVRLARSLGVDGGQPMASGGDATAAVAGWPDFSPRLTADLAPDPALFDALADREAPPQELLPDSGVGIVRERYLATAFIAPEAGADVFGGYGTRASTLLEARGDGRARFTERTWHTPGAPDAGYAERDESFSFAPGVRQEPAGAVSAANRTRA